MSSATLPDLSNDVSVLSQDYIPEQLADYSLIRVCRPECTVHDGCDNGGKRPVTSVDDIEPTGRVSDWIAQGGNAGIVPKSDDNLIILDIDSDRLARIAKKSLPETFSVETQNGAHRYYEVPGWTRNYGWGEMGSIRANNWMAVIPPSAHPSGDIYSVNRDLPITTVSPQEIKHVVDQVDVETQTRSSGSPKSVPGSSQRVSPLSFIQKSSIRNRMEQYLKAPNPDHDDRVWLVGWLYNVPDNHDFSQRDIVDLIMRHANWNSLDRETVRSQVQSVISSSS